MKFCGMVTLHIKASNHGIARDSYRPWEGGGLVIIDVGGRAYYQSEGDIAHSSSCFKVGNQSLASICKNSCVYFFTKYL